LAPAKEYHAERVVHQQDVRRPLDRPRQIPAERLVAALEAIPKIGGCMKLRQTTKGRRRVATDLDHAVGRGPEVRGPAEALIRAGSGRPAALAELDGDGVGALAARIT
jgi:hypothetical protein